MTYYLFYIIIVLLVFSVKVAVYDAKSRGMGVLWQHLRGDREMRLNPLVGLNVADDIPLLEGVKVCLLAQLTKLGHLALLSGGDAFGSNCGGTLLVGRYYCLIGLEHLYLEHDVDPSCEICFHEIQVVLFDFSKDFSFFDDREALVDPTNDFLEDEVFVDKEEEEPLEQGILRQMLEAWDTFKYVLGLLPEEFSLIREVFISLCQLLDHIDISPLF